MDEARLEDIQRKAKLREQETELRNRRAAAGLRLEQQERQAQDEAQQAEVAPAEEQHYAQLPRHPYTGIR
ncbi:hypothetical protein ACIQGT_25695 [Streptomyces sp. NPDC093108]|jgi:hypothetical protein|uniref:hypothetical protein n=1 Tax=Streptomyces sp. NPDC093108 TaxID=3366030 RepID=UPI0037F391EA